MLLNLIDRYRKDKELFEKLHKTYNNNLILCDQHDFFSQSIQKNTLKKWLNYIYNLFLLQLILNTNIYFPGLWLFELEKTTKLKSYNFEKDFIKIKINDKIEKENNYIERLITKDWKIDFSFLNNSKIQVRQAKNEDKFTFYSNISTIIRYLNWRLIKEFDIKRKKPYIFLSKKYTWIKNLKEIKEDYLLNKSNWIWNHLLKIDTSRVLYNQKILEDIIILIWYLENK